MTGLDEPKSTRATTDGPCFMQQSDTDILSDYNSRLWAVCVKLAWGCTTASFITQAML